MQLFAVSLSQFDTAEGKTGGAEVFAVLDVAVVFLSLVEVDVVDGGAHTENGNGAGTGLFAAAEASYGCNNSQG